MAVIRSVTNIVAFRNGMNAENCGSGVAADGATIPSAIIKTATTAFADRIWLAVGGKFINPSMGASSSFTRTFLAFFYSGVNEFLCYPPTMKIDLDHWRLWKSAIVLRARQSPPNVRFCSRQNGMDHAKQSQLYSAYT